MTRRPNRRASSEYAPGPSSASAAASNMAGKKYGLPEWGPTRKFATADKQVSTDVTGVKKPIVRNVAISKTTARSRFEEKTPARFALAFKRRIDATEIRRSTKATPGPP